MDPSCCCTDVNLDFVLTNLDRTCSLGTNAEVSDGIYDPSFSYDAIAEYRTSVSLWNQIFQIQINDYILEEQPTANDVKFIINSASLDYFAYLVCQKPIGEYSIVTNDTAIGHNTLTASPYINQCIDHDYVRYLAQSLFNTHFATSLFINRDALINSVDNSIKSAWQDILTSLKSISDKGADENLEGPPEFQYLTNNLSTSKNICRELYLQLISQLPVRFTKLQNITTSQPLPIIAGDTVCIRITVNPSVSQQIYTDNPIQPRRYLIKFILS
jgi:hypothetical protein